MKFLAGQIAEMLQGTVEGNANIEVDSLSKIEEGKAGSLSFLANPKYAQYIYSTDASVIIVNSDFKATAPIKSTLVRVESAELAFSKVLETYNQIKLNKVGISPQSSIADSATIGENIYTGEFAVISDKAKIGNNVKIYPQVYIGENVTIGDNTTLFAGVKVYSDCEIGKDCIIHSGTVIGSDGFRFAVEAGGQKVPQIGNVLIEDNVEMGSNCSIDRATLGSTIIRRGVKFDNQIHIAHNVEVKENCYLAAQTIIAGSSTIGKNCMFSGQVGVVGHLDIADHTVIAAQSGISKSIKKPGQGWMGSPAFEVGKYRKAYVNFKNIGQLADRVSELEKKLNP